MMGLSTHPRYPFTHSAFHHVTLSNCIPIFIFRRNSESPVPLVRDVSTDSPQQHQAIGACTRGELCAFAHPTSENAAPPVNFHRREQEMETARQNAKRARNILSTRMCKKFAIGVCTRGDLCAFAHPSLAPP